MKTAAPKLDEITHAWYLIDADGLILGRLASQVAQILLGKNKPNYAPYLDMGDNVIIINAAKVRVTGKKLSEKIYYHYSGYPGGLKSTTLAEQLAKDPCEVILKAVHGMLPKNRLNSDRLARLKVFTGAEHAHTAQNPTKLELN